MRRAYHAADARGKIRCSQSIKLRDGSGAQCMREAVTEGLCRQHAKKAEKARRLIGGAS